MTAAPLLQAALLSSIWWPAVHPVPCGLSIHPVDPIVPFGGSVTLNCTSSCANNTQLNWEISTQGEVHKADRWTSVSFVNITVWDFQPVCYGDSSGNPVKMPIYLYRMYA
ncbi:intercellular adhesion molecule 1-like [Sphaerodactylus townsendi]|uniref:intercellular adhesion molecule 1-like n=1 Tax=Sphaerodactylus townsendi TaxID=933632 RepID=UPI002026CE2E|nr:intercellular adhesion molecule 1-like [Sphaerodactylus townsendi]